MRISLVKREQASGAVLNFLISALATVMVTRLYLRMTGNPTIAWGQWHIAHLLWGGLLMMAGVVLLLAFEGKGLRKTVTIISGIGWGLFIDEIGKYVTRDNNYWFRPAILFIYLSFIILFLVYRLVERYQPIDPRSQFYWLISRLEKIVEGGVTEQDKYTALKKLESLKNRGGQGVLTAGIEGIIKKVKVVEHEEKLHLAKWISRIFNISYNKIFRRNLVMLMMWGYAVYYSINKIIDAIAIGTSKQKMLTVEKFYANYDFLGRSDGYMIALKIVFEVVAALCFLLGAGYFWSKKRIRGLKYFRYGLLVSILLVAPFKFYFEQYGAVIEVVVSILAYQLVVTYRREAIR